jgi:hypothetical protein
MNRNSQLLLGLVASLLLLLAGIPQPAGADGIAIEVVDSRDHEHDVEMPAQKAILVYDEQSQREDLILSVELRGGPEAAWVVPVPSLPEVETASPEWFEQLSYMTKPIVEYRTETIYREAGGEIVVTVGEEVVVEVISREEVGVYDVSILAAGEPGALVNWLNENGYAYPEEGEPLLDTYMEEGGWYFVAARVLPEKSDRLDGDVHPLWFSFETERPIYPMRLTSLMRGHIHVLIYVLADHRMEIPEYQFYTEFAGELPLSSMNSENPELVELLTHRPYYVTKLRQRSLYTPKATEDFYLEQAASDEPYRMVLYETRYQYVDVTDRVTPGLQTRRASATDEGPAEQPETPQDGDGMMLGVGLALLAVLAGVVLVRWQRSRPKPGKES